MQNYTNGRLRCHTPRPPQPQFSTMLGSQARNPSFHDAFSPELLGPFQYSQEEAKSPLYEPQLNEIDEQSRSVDSYGNVDCGSQSSTDNSAEELPHTPRSDGAQGCMPRRSPFSLEDYLVGPPQENDELQTGEHSRSVDTSFQQPGDHIGATSAFNLGDKSRHITSWESSTTLPPGLKPHHVNHVSRNLQATTRTRRRSSLEHHSQWHTSNSAIIQAPFISRSFANHANTSDRQVNPPGQVTANGMDPSLILPVDGGVLDWASGNERTDPVWIHRSFPVDSVFPKHATSRAHSSHIGQSVSEVRRNSQSPYQSVAQYHRAPAFQPQAQVGRRGTRGSPSFAQDPSMMSYGMQPLVNDEFARNAQELTKGVQADNPQAGNPEMYLSPNWTPGHKASSETHCDDGSDLSDNEVRQRPHITPEDQHRAPTRGSKREYPTDSQSPTTTSTKKKRIKRKFNEEEKARISLKRKTGACNDCRKAKRRVCESLQTSLYHFQQAYCGCSARMSPLGLSPPLELSLSRANPLSALHPAGLRNE